MAAKRDMEKSPVGSSSTVSYRMPNVKMDIFNGDVMQFPTWENSFDALIGNRVECSKYKMNLLSQFLSGEPRQLIQGLLLHQGEEAYTSARQRLRSRYGNPSVILQALLDKLSTWPKIGANQSKDLMRFSDFLMQINELKGTLEGLCILDYEQETRKIILKLPTYLHHKWKETFCEWKQEHGEGSYPPSKTVMEFVKLQTNMENIPELQDLHKRNNQLRAKLILSNPRQDNKPARALATTANSTKADTKKCSYCDESHEVNDCTKIMQLSDDERFRFFQDKHLCFGCGISSAHQSRQCQNRAKCTSCGGPHPTSLHRNPPSEQPQQASSYCTEAKGENSFDCSMIIPCWVQNEEIPGKEIISYCILDDQSNTCFVSNRLKEKLGLIGQPTNLTLSTIHKSNTLIPTEKVTNLRIQSLDRTVSINVPQIFSRDTIPASRQQIPTADVVQKWEHLKCIHIFLKQKLDCYWEAIYLKLQGREK